MRNSELRQVPDNQEVLLGLEDDTTIIVEVLENVKEGSARDNLDEAIRYVSLSYFEEYISQSLSYCSFHFASLAHDNAASSSQVIEVFSLPDNTTLAPLSTEQATPSPLLLMGEQVVQKFGKESEPQDRVRIYLALWRLTPVKDVDLIMSLNEPLSTSTNEPTGSAHDTFIKAAQSLLIKDWGLFAA
jgi:hypothetical protein